MKPMVTTMPTQAQTDGRCGPGQPLAIVLHEFDGAIETLDARHRNCPKWAEPGCHVSFHYGISNCIIHQYVDDADTAWSFDPDPDAEECGTGDWQVAADNPGVDPNCYTINIAVATGVATASMHCHNPRNLYSDQLIRCLARLVCYLSEEYGIPNDSDHVWLHLKELCDFPYDEFAAAVQECLDEPDVIVPPEIDNLCDQIALMPVAPAPSDTVMVVGADCMIYPVAVGGDSDALELQDCAGNALDLTLPVQVVTCTDPASVDCASAPQTAIGLTVDGSAASIRGRIPVRAVTADTTLVPASDGVVAVDASAGNTIVTLAPPGDCDPNDFWIKRTDASANTVTVAGGGPLIDGCPTITLDTPGPFCNQMGETAHVAWDGQQWLIL